jgi:ABC-type nitrate/sulfonate/bicarbonate transport system permease component
MRSAAWAPLAIRTAFVVLAVLLWDFCVRFGWVNALFLAGPVDTL